MDPAAHAIARTARGFLAVVEGLRLFGLARVPAPVGPILEIGIYCGKSSV
jgi:hypothetical protein